MSNIVIKGNLTRDAEAVPTQGEKGLLKFSVADTRSKKDSAGNWVDDPHYIDCVYWTKNVQDELVKLKKGTPVMIFGEWKNERWEKDGTKYSKITVHINSFKEIQIGIRSQQAAQTPPENEEEIGF